MASTLSNIHICLYIFLYAYIYRIYIFTYVLACKVIMINHSVIMIKKCLKCYFKEVPQNNWWLIALLSENHLEL